MTGIHPSNDRGPWFVVAGHAVHTPALLVGGCVLSMLLTTFAVALNVTGLQDLVAFSSEAVLRRFEVWRLFTYVVWNEPSIWFAIDMLMLWWFGRELESFFGRKVFLKLCAGLILFPALVGLLVGVVEPVRWVGMPGNFSLFVAYATLAPGVSLLFGVSAMWTVIIFLGLQVLSCLTKHSWGEMVLALGGASFAFVYVRIQQGRWELPQVARMMTPARKPQFRVLEPAVHPVAERRSVSTSGDLEDLDALDAIDPLLEKIGRTGMASLTAGERQQLQLAREELIKKESLRR